MESGSYHARRSLPVIVSVVIATRNDAQRVGFAIVSVLNQTLSEFELIVVNDNSTDGTARVLERYREADSRISVITNPKQLGRAGARNVGIMVARGEFIAVLDSDDMMFPERLSRQVEFMRRNTAVGVLGTAGVFDMEGHYHDKHTPTDGPVIRRNLSRGRNLILNSSILCRKSVLLLVGGYQSSPYSPTFNEDYITFRTLRSHTEFANLETPLILVCPDGIVNPRVIRKKLREMNRYEVHTLPDSLSVARILGLLLRGLVAWLPDSLLGALYNHRLRAWPSSQHAETIRELKRRVEEQKSNIERTGTMRRMGT
ncbi:MAG: glycosyltransferase [Gemmatimonadota bacterium]|nr:glycosyltransferase [Gemmatimonadota bacterium]